jgi:hypothetical protein
MNDQRPEDPRRKREEERQKQQRMVLLMLGFACLIQLWVSLQRSREITGQWIRSREDETRAFDKKIRDEAGPGPAEGAP